tara:strand:+ start:17439 stop:18065 length:627 start_codon:yes stop_codon:yes gene_type:complete
MFTINEMQNAPTTHSQHEQESAALDVQKDVAFRELVERNQKRAFWMALDILGSEAEAEDISQDAFIRTYERWDEFRGDASRDTWFTRILINLCLSRKRRHGIWNRIRDWMQQQPEKNPLVSQSVQLLHDPESLANDRDTADAIREALQSLSERQRTAFVLRYLHDFSIQEIAVATDSAPGTIKSHLFRAIRTLRTQLDALQPDGGGRS